MRDEPQNRPPWLRNLRPRYEVESLTSSAAVSEEFVVPVSPAETPLETSPVMENLSTHQYMLLLAFLVWLNITVLGCLCLLATQRVVP
ncbi:MAG: hypothetical protein NZ765_10720 [Anaerolineae bacterium]|nr:hypothetical protein [Anaerolineae bacterium]MDW8072080.1 hypothetical protein [Anaerolineae bacterium]